VQRERSEAVRRCSGTFAKVVCVTIPGLQRTTRLRLALRSARETPLILAPMGLDPRVHLLRKTLFAKKKMDCRVKPGNDGGEASVPIPKFAHSCGTSDANFGIKRTLAT